MQCNNKWYLILEPHYRKQSIQHQQRKIRSNDTVSILSLGMLVSSFETVFSLFNLFFALVFNNFVRMVLDIFRCLAILFPYSLMLWLFLFLYSFVVLSFALWLFPSPLSSIIVTPLDTFCFYPYFWCTLYRFFVVCSFMYFPFIHFSFLFKFLTFLPYSNY